ncbi:MAG: rod shape-determining protein MreC [Candidatus Pelagibacter sp. TMED196]|nr:MAG: rod shape-determining protein MreC [Candidatus Pelagibacter sp. TMED196]
MATSRDDFGIAIRSALLQRGAKQKFSLFALILASILVFTLDNLEIKPIKVLRGVINDGVYRLSAITSSPISFASASKNFLSTHLNIYKENEELKKKIEILQKNRFDTLYLQTENNKLQEVLDLDKTTSYTTVGAKIMLDKNSPYLNSVIINKGSNVGIQLGMPVLSKGNLVGRIVEVNYISSRILLLNDLNSKIPAVISPSGEQAILSGIGQKNPTLEYLPDDFQIIDDLTVYTSGKDGVLFPGISIGKVLLDQDDESDEGRIRVKLFSEPTQILYVNVVLDKSNDEEAK